MGHGPIFPLEEDAAPAPTTAYERSKAEAERVALEFARRGLDVVLARPGFIYGPGDRHVLGLFRAIQMVGRPFLAPPATGARTSIRLAADPDLDGRTGGCYSAGELRTSSARSRGLNGIGHDVEQ